MRLSKLFKHKSIRICSVLLFLALIIGFQYACLDSLNNSSSDHPINTAIIGLSPNPAIIFGNASEESVIQVNTNLVPDGTPINFEITFSPSGIQPQLRGCLFDSTGKVEGNLASVNYLAGVFVGIGQTATVNISATIQPVNGNEESNFLTMNLSGVGIIAPTPAPITFPTPGPTMGPIQSVEVTLIYNTVGIELGTMPLVTLSDPSIGTLDSVSTVLGSLDAGQFIVQYTAIANMVGTQIITAKIQLQIPPELSALCPMISDKDGLIEVVVVITQTKS